MMLRMLAEAVNAVTDWPQHAAYCDDEPRSLTIGFSVGELRWRCTVRQVKLELPLLYAKRNQLRAMAKGVRIPLHPYPDNQRERELLVRAALLSSAVYVTNTDMRRTTADWVTFLGRLRAAPNGALLDGIPYLPPLAHELPAWSRRLA